MPKGEDKNSSNPKLNTANAVLEHRVLHPDYSWSDQDTRLVAEETQWIPPAVNQFPQDNGRRFRGVWLNQYKWFRFVPGLGGGVMHQADVTRGGGRHLQPQGQLARGILRNLKNGISILAAHDNSRVHCLCVERASY